MGECCQFFFCNCRNNHTNSIKYSVKHDLDTNDLKMNHLYIFFNLKTILGRELGFVENH